MPWVAGADAEINETLPHRAQRGRGAAERTRTGPDPPSPEHRRAAVNAPPPAAPRSRLGEFVADELRADRSMDPSSPWPLPPHGAIPKRDPLGHPGHGQHLGRQVETDQIELDSDRCSARLINQRASAWVLTPTEQPRSSTRYSPRPAAVRQRREWHPAACAEPRGSQLLVWPDPEGIASVACSASRRPASRDCPAHKHGSECSSTPVRHRGGALDQQRSGLQPAIAPGADARESRRSAVE